MADFTFTTLADYAIDKSGWTKGLRKLTLTHNALREQLHIMALGAIEHFMGQGSGNVTRLNDLDARLHGGTGGLFRVWVMAAIGDMVSYSKKEGKFKVRRGWAAARDTLNESVLAVNPLDFGRVERDPSAYRPANIVTALTGLLSKAEGDVSKSQFIEEQDEPMFEALQGVLKNAIAQAKAITQDEAIEPSSQDDGDTVIQMDADDDDVVDDEPVAVTA